MIYIYDYYMELMQLMKLSDCCTFLKRGPWTKNGQETGMFPLFDSNLKKKCILIITNLMMKIFWLIINAK